RIDPRTNILDKLLGQILMDATRTEVCGVHARAGSTLVEHHQLLALFKAPQRRGQSTNIHGLRRHVQDVRHDAADLAVEHADQLAALRHLNTEQTLNCQAESVLLVHRRAIVQTVQIWDSLQVCLVLHQLLGAAMQQPDMRISTINNLTIELQNEAKNAVRCWMLRAKVDVEITNGCLSHNAPQFGLAFSSPGST